MPLHEASGKIWNQSKRSKVSRFDVNLRVILVDLFIHEHNFSFIQLFQQYWIYGDSSCLPMHTPRRKQYYKIPPDAKKVPPDVQKITPDVPSKNIHTWNFFI